MSQLPIALLSPHCVVVMLLLVHVPKLFSRHIHASVPSCRTVQPRATADMYTVITGNVSLFVFRGYCQVYPCPRSGMYLAKKKNGLLFTTTLRQPVNALRRNSRL